MTSRYLFGEWSKVDGPINVSEATDICDLADISRARIATYPLSKIYELFDYLGSLWKNENYPLRVEAQNKLPKITGFSKETIKLGLDEITPMFNSTNLKKKMETELQGVPRGVNFKFDPETSKILRWHPLGNILHILSGNVFLVGPGSLIEGVLTGNTTLLKMSGSETFFMPLFIKSLEEAERVLEHENVISSSLATFEYSSSQSDIIDIFKHRMNGILVWGGEQAVRSYRNNLPAKTRLILFGPKLSFSIVTKMGIEQYGYQDIAQKLAKEISVWDQNACTAPQLCFVEGLNNAQKLATFMESAIPEILKELPPGDMDPNAAAEIQKLRTIFEISEVRDKGFYRGSCNNLDWTIILDKNVEIQSSPLNRTIRIVPIDNIESITEQMEELRGYIQTVGLSANVAQQINLSQILANSGALRILPLGEMDKGDIDDPHDGAYDLPQLMNLVTTKIDMAQTSMLIEQMNSVDLAMLQTDLLYNILGHAKKSPLYLERLKDINVNSVDDISKLPILSKVDLQKNMPPQNRNLCTEDFPYGGQVTKSGGSTGVSKYSWFTKKDWKEMVKCASDIFTMAGFNKSDRIANCLYCGGLYGSFTSFDDANLELGMTAFNFANVVDSEEFYETWKKFSINSIQGFPSSIINLLKQIKSNHPDFTLEKFMYAGEPLSSDDRLWLKNSLGVKIIASIIGTTEAGPLAYQTPECAENEYRLINDYNLIEIVDEFGNPVPMGEEGRILVTTLKKFSFPLIRYDIGDLGKIIAKDTPTGPIAYGIEYGGRHDDILSIGQSNLDYKDIRNYLEVLQINDIQLEANFNQTDVLGINIETNKSISDDEVLSILLKKIKDLKHAAQKNWIKIEIKYFKPGQLERNPRTGKLKRIIDRRKRP